MRVPEYQQSVQQQGLPGAMTAGGSLLSSVGSAASSYAVAKMK